VPETLNTLLERIDLARVIGEAGPTDRFGASASEAGDGLYRFPGATPGELARLADAVFRVRFGVRAGDAGRARLEG